MKDMKINKKLGSLIFVTCLLIGCGLFGISTGKYGPVVYCDANQPMDELLKCVDERYALMDKNYKSKWLEAHEKLARFNKRTYEKPSEYKEISHFTSIKPDNEYLRMDGYPKTQLRVDDYKNLKMRVSQRIGMISLYFSGENKYGKFVGAGSIDTYKYLRSAQTISRDVLVTKKGKDNKVYAASYEIVPLLGDKFLFVVAVANFCQKHFDKKDLKPSMPGYVSIKTKVMQQVMHKADINNYFEACGINYVYFIGDMMPNLSIFVNWAEFPAKTDFSDRDLSTYTNEIITLSADKRENPTELYIKLNNRYFSLKLN